MKLSTRTRYGLRMMIQLMSNYESGRPLSLRKIAEKENFSEKYMEQIVAFLMADRLITSVRGKYGGYLLARNPRDITLKDIVYSLEPKKILVDCNKHGKPCERQEKCIAKKLWENITMKVYEVFDSVALEDLRKYRSDQCCHPQPDRNLSQT